MCKAFYLSGESNFFGFKVMIGRGIFCELRVGAFGRFETENLGFLLGF